MTYSIRQQLQRVRRLRRQTRPPRILVYVAEPGEPMPDDIRRKARPEDIIIRREIPVGYLRDGREMR
jgi:hypothetical protein